MEDKKLLEQYKHLIKKLAQKVCKNDADFDDLVNIGKEKFLEVYSKFNPSNNCGMITYTRKRILGAMRDELKKRNWFRRSKSGFHMVYLEDVPPPLLIHSGLIIDIEQKVLENESLNIVVEKLKKLPVSDQKILYLWYWEKFSIKEISEILDINETKCYYIHNKILKKLKKLLKR